MALSPGYSESDPNHQLYTALLQVFNPTAGSPSPPHSSGGVYRSSDGGSTWAAVGAPGPFDQGASAVAVAPDGRLFAGYLAGQYSGLLCSVDGQSWQASCPAVGGNAHAGPGVVSGQSCQAPGCSPAVPGDALGGSAVPAAAGDVAATSGGSSASQMGALGGLMRSPAVWALWATLVVLVAIVAFVLRARRQSATRVLAGTAEAEAGGPDSGA